MAAAASSISSRVALAAALAAAGACDSRRVDVEELDRVTVTDRQSKRALDLLWVIDDSGSMAEEQSAVGAAFGAFLGSLEQIEGGLPDLRVAVVSTNLGGAPGIVGCGGSGQNGALQNRGCLAEGLRWMEDVEDPACDGPPDACRLRNFEGEPSEVFTCLSALGTNGCGFEQPLEAMRRALDTNPDFLRPGAALAVIFVGDEDDCSAAGPALFDPSEETALGPLHSFRCFEHGVVCDPDQPRALGEKAGCRPREDSRYMHPIARYTEFLTGLDPAPRALMVAAVIGPAEPVAVELDPSNPQRFQLDETCDSDVGHAEPGIRLQALVDAMGGVSFPICNSGTADATLVMSDAAGEIVGQLADSLDGECLQADVYDLDAKRDGVQADCVVIEGAELDEIPPCDDAGGARPCYRIGLSDSCVGTASGLAIFVERDTTPAPGTKVSASCLVLTDDRPTRSVYDCTAGRGGASAWLLAALALSVCRRRRRRAPTAS